jgi:hypothetical protein
METKQFSLNTNRKSAKKPTAVMELIQSQPAAAPSPEALARRAYAIYEHQGSQPGHEVKHWLEAEAQLFGASNANPKCIRVHHFSHTNNKHLSLYETP